MSDSELFGINLSSRVMMIFLRVLSAASDFSPTSSGIRARTRQDSAGFGWTRLHWLHWLNRPDSAGSVEWIRLSTLNSARLDLDQLMKIIIIMANDEMITAM